MESESVRFCVQLWHLSDYIHSTWHKVGTQYLLPGCLCSTSFMCDYHSVRIVSGEAAACGLWVSVGCQFPW